MNVYIPRKSKPMAALLRACAGLKQILTLLYVSAQPPHVHRYCTPRHQDNCIVKYEEHTTITVCITNNDESSYQEEIRNLAE